MSCPYYTWRRDYYCVKNDASVNEEIYKKYCRKYDYDRCPIYRNEGYINDTEDGCFITSACVEAMGLPDDCEELTTLRQFRDNWLAKQPGGQEEIEEYYRIAPRIVKAIRTKNEAKDVFSSIYRSMVLPCVTAIKSGREEDTWELYRNMTKKLQLDYLEEQGE